MIFEKSFYLSLNLRLLRVFSLNLTKLYKNINLVLNEYFNCRWREFFLNIDQDAAAITITKKKKSLEETCNAEKP